MAELKIKNGSKLRIAYDVEAGKEPDFNMMSTFNKALDESAFLISVPMQGGKPIPLDEGQKLLIRYGDDATGFITAGYPDDVVKEGIRTFWKIRRVTENRMFFKRADERLKIALKVEFMQDTWPLNFEGFIEKEDGLTLDISAGGLALYTSRRFEVAEIVTVDLPRIGLSPDGKEIKELNSQVCWMREAPKGSPYKNICGLQFKVDEAEKDRLNLYCANIKKRYKL